jgi:ribonuclease T1
VRRLLLLLLGAVLLVSGCTTTASDTVGRSGLPMVALTDLPPQAQQTYDLIRRGGPYPYRQDDEVFGNREGLLPDEEYGWYREYTVETPGSDDRGARRFVVGEDDTFFYTDDHYASFSEVIP